MKYDVEVRLTGSYANIEAENEEEAFIIASDAAIESGDWYRKVTPVESEG